jgi:hypothetical protein
MRKALNSNSISPVTFSNYYNYSNRQYDRINKSFADYLIDNYKQTYINERWKQIIYAKRINKRLRGIDFRKERLTPDVDDYTKGIFNDFNEAISNGKKERYLQLRLIENRNKSIQAFLDEDEIQDIINEAESYPEARAEIIRRLNDYSEDGQTVVVETSSGGTRHYDIQYYTDMVIRTAVREIQTMATLDAANEVGTDLVEFSVHNTLCFLCAPYEGKIYSIDGKNPYFPPLDETPPIHPNPYDKKTMVLTKNKGYIFIKDAKLGDICLSLNKETNETEYVKVTKLYRFKKEKMIRFESKEVDMIVSKEHQMLITDGETNRLVNAESLLNEEHNFFIAGKYPHYIYYHLKDINKKIIDYNDYAYCVELEKNHVLYAMRNGKCMWSGNCLHSLTVVFESVLLDRGNFEDYVKFSNGQSEIHPTAKGWIPIAERNIK